MIRSKHTFRAFAMAALASTFLGSGIMAQEPGSEGTDEESANAQELARQIRRNMLKIEDELAKAATHDTSKGDQVKKDIERLLDTMKQRQSQIVKDIDDIIKQMKQQGGGGGGSGSSDSNENQGKSKSRDRNKGDNKSKPRDGNEGKKPEGKKPKKGQKPSDQKGGGAEDNRRKADDPGANQPGDPREEPKPERFVKIDLNEIWGNLPPELRQKLVDRNFDDFTPEYRDQINEYFKKTSSTPK